ncbi:type VI secretion protein [Pseudomonas brassicacearum]|uniref:Type VI secretion protein n=1 Tax=Pseudomonas brassicacearum TaxID=930166 RepID=A0A423HSV6_9PSED|nr:contractile injection system protein, VgrG/Pvc8 family [Pseudomonas brassicacearum]RON16320.1 type VI secretion protein [Pseudomonas brassicacearum]
MFDPANEPSFRLDVEGLPDPFAVLALTGSEAISEPFEFNMDLLIGDPALDLASLLYRPAFLHVGPPGNGFHGQLHELVQTGQGATLRRCRVRLKPKLACLAQRFSQRIFSNRSVPEILAQVLKEHGIAGKDRRFELTGDYPPRDFCTQYQESDLQFFQRLCAQERLHYHFEHRRRGHCLVMGDGQVQDGAELPCVTKVIGPRMHSLQRAWVVEVDEPQPDATRPVAVQFDWLYQGEGAAPSHCWLSMAPELSGDHTMPLREGLEVLVSFIEGDPDQPLITGFLCGAPVTQAADPQPAAAAAADDDVSVDGLLHLLQSSEPLVLLCLLPGGGSFVHCTHVLCACRAATQLGQSGAP